MRKVLPILFLWLLIALGVFLRTYKVDFYPTDGNDDGLYYAWAGVSIIKNPLRPTSHSIFDKDNQAMIWRSQFKDFLPDQRFGMKITQPWFDHPPLAMPLIGLPAYLLGYHGLEQIPEVIVRYPALIASIFVLLFTYILAKDLFPAKGGQESKTAYLSLAIFATVPYFVFAHRQSFLENFLTPLLLLSLILLKNKKYIYSILIASLLGWFKLPFFAIPLAIAAWLLINKNYKYFKISLIAGLLSVGLYILYGLAINSQIFLQTMFNQGIRGAFVSSLRDTISWPHYYDSLADGWYLLGFLSLFALLFNQAKNNNLKFIKFFIIALLVLFFIISGPFNNSPWYYYPLLPFISISLGYYLNIFLEKPNLVYAVIFWVLGLTGFDLLGININASLLRILTILFLLPFGFDLIINKKFYKKFIKIFSLLFIIFLILLNIYTSLKFPAVYCSTHSCWAPGKIILNIK